MARQEVVLETRNLSMHFGGVRAVDNVDFELREKELRCLIGPNGAGKSTFFKCLTGQLSPTSGDVVIRDITMTGREPHEVAGLGVGIKTQVPNLFDGLTASENLWLSARRWHGEKRATVLVKQTIERLELGEIRSSFVGSLAHGQPAHGCCHPEITRRRRPDSSRRRWIGCDLGLGLLFHQFGNHIAPAAQVLPRLCRGFYIHTQSNDPAPVHFIRI